MIKKLLQSWITAVTLLIAIIWIGSGVLEKRDALHAVEKQEAHLQAKIAEIKDTDEDLTQIDRDTYLERQARERLNYKYPDEQVVHIFHNDETSITQTNEFSDTKPDISRTKSNVSLWWDYILDK